MVRDNDKLIERLRDIFKSFDLYSVKKGKITLENCPHNSSHKEFEITLFTCHISPRIPLA